MQDVFIFRCLLSINLFSYYWTIYKPEKKSKSLVHLKANFYESQRAIIELQFVKRNKI